MDTPSLYKYRSLQGDAFKYTQDIFINRRLYLPSIPEFNDPNEGIAEILVENEYKAWANQIEERNRKEMRLYSFSEDYKNSLMWSHYANNQAGICIEFNLKNYHSDSRSVLRKVEYLEAPKQFAHQEMANYFDFFMHKKNDWSYEKEWRIIADKETMYITLANDSISAVYLGPRISKENVEWVNFWTKYFNQDANIPIIQMTYESTKYDLIEKNNASKNLKRFII